MFSPEFVNNADSTGRLISLSVSLANSPLLTVKPLVQGNCQEEPARIYHHFCLREIRDMVINAGW